MDVFEGEVISSDATDDTFPSLEQVNKNALKRLNELILNASADEIPALIESLSKYNTSLRNNEVFTPRETEEEKEAKQKNALVEELLKKG